MLFRSGAPWQPPCGGGVAVRQENVQNMKKNGTIVLLRATPATILKRVRHSTNRPLLNGKMNEEAIAEMMEKRRQLYLDAADLVIDVDEKKPSAIVREILHSI